jgi:hypothetical protein
MKLLNEHEAQNERFEIFLKEENLATIGGVIIAAVEKKNYFFVKQYIASLLNKADILPNMYNVEKGAFYDELLKLESLKAYTDFIKNIIIK